jgi:uncharacterized protein (DUF924 family)
VTDAAAESGVVQAGDMLTFWRAAGPKKWYTKDSGFDAEITRRFLPIYEAAVAGQLSHWEGTPDGALALVIALDQFPRNMFRGSARTFAVDALARTAADRAIRRGFDQQIAVLERQFLYIPFEHSEDPADQERSLRLFRANDDAEALKWAELHADIIRRLGRFPHRNAILGRTSTADEQAFLDSGGFAG